MKIAIALLLISTPLFAQTNPVYKQQALANLNAGRYAEAIKNAQDILQQKSDDQDGLLILAASHHRLENYDEAIKAYEQYLATNPPESKATKIKSTLNTLKERAKRYNEYKYSNHSNGFFLGFSPTVSSQVADDLGSDLDSNFDLGFSFGKWSLGFRTGSGTTEQIQAAPRGTLHDNPPPTFTLLSGTPKHTIYELYASGIAPFNEPYINGSTQYAFLWHFGGVQNSVEVDGRKFGQIGFDLGLGANARYFTKSTLAFDLSGLYHLAIPFWGIREDADSHSIKNKSGKEIDSSSSGFEIRLSVLFLFGADTTDLTL